MYWAIRDDGRKILVTENAYRGNTVYGEDIAIYDNKEFRYWDPYRSKYSAAIYNGLRDIYIKEGYTVLYLGAASGTTASHVADLTGRNGIIFCVEFSARTMRDLLNVTAIRKNMIPILGDARTPEQYRALVTTVDVIYQDVAQPQQADILVKNARAYLKKGGITLLAIKARSIDVTKEPSIIYRQEIETLEKNNFEILETVELEPYDKDHTLVVSKYLG